MTTTKSYKGARVIANGAVRCGDHFHAFVALTLDEPGACVLVWSEWERDRQTAVVDACDAVDAMDYGRALAEGWCVRELPLHEMPDDIAGEMMRHTLIRQTMGLSSIALGDEKRHAAIAEARMRKTGVASA